MFEKGDSSNRQKKKGCPFSASFMEKCGSCLNTGKCFFLEVSFFKANRKSISYSKKQY